MRLKYFKFSLNVEGCMDDERDTRVLGFDTTASYRMNTM